jgi:stage V sporulation protein B
LISRKKGRILTKFFSIAIPVAATRYVNSILHAIENILVPNKLRDFHSSHERALEEFGIIKGMAIPILFFPASFIGAISSLLLPEMSEANELHNKNKIKKLTEKTLQFTIISSILIGGIFFVFAYELAETVYKNIEVGHVIKMLAPIVPFMYIESMITGMLQGLNQQMSSLRYLISDSVIRIALVFFLVPIKGLDGFLYIMIVSNICTSCLNLKRLLTVTNAKIDFRNWILKPLGSLGLGALCVLYFTKNFNLSTLPYLIIGITIVSIIYVVGILISHSIKFDKLKFTKTKC